MLASVDGQPAFATREGQQLVRRLRSQAVPINWTMVEDVRAGANRTHAWLQQQRPPDCRSSTPAKPTTTQVGPQVGAAHAARLQNAVSSSSALTDTGRGSCTAASREPGAISLSSMPHIVYMAFTMRMKSAELREMAANERLSSIRRAIANVEAYTNSKITYHIVADRPVDTLRSRVCSSPEWTGLQLQLHSIDWVRGIRDHYSRPQLRRDESGR
eukprot:5880990-Prymnesium_polylepis.1